MKVKSGVWSFCSHRVKIRIEGFSIARLINKARDAGIIMKNITFTSDTEAEGWIAAADLKKMRALGRNNYRITAVSGGGPVSTVCSIIARPATLAGAVLAALIIAVQSMFVSTIKINGYKAIPEDSLRHCLEEAGIKEGAFRPQIDWEGARGALRETFPQLTWIQLVYDGRVVLLNVEESSNKILSAEAEPGSDIFLPSHSGEKRCVSIVAAQSGYIETISPLWGQARVEAGDFVKKGDVLISGVVPIETTTFEEDWPTEYYVHAKGEVTALVPYRLTFNQERYIADEAQPGKNTIADRREKTREEAERVLAQQIRLWAEENLPENAEIVNESLNFSVKNNIIEIGMTLEVRQQIGIEKEISVGSQNSDH